MSLKETFETIGGSIKTPIDTFKERLLLSKVIVFDWDGVFNDGSKDPSRGSVFSEVDAMGTNLLRFSFWLKHGTLPIVALMSGAANLIAGELANREHFDAVFTKSINKKSTYIQFLAGKGIDPMNGIFFFDDVLDLGICELGGINIQIRRPNNPLLNDFIDRKSLVDYTTSRSGGSSAVREACELLMGINGNFDECVQKRADFHDDYQAYLSQRNSTKTIVKEG